MATNPRSPSQVIHTPARPGVRTTDTFRRSVGLCIYSKYHENKVFAARRRDDSSGCFQMPQGGIDPLENPLVAAHRELFEETGIRKDLVRVVTSIDAWLDYEHPTVSHGVQYRGQTQKWVLLEFTGRDDDVDLCHLGEDAREFEDWTWMELDEIVDGIVWFKREVYEDVRRQFKGYLTT
jgi:putative (di)nucleoside polyphosphate hydrolase